MFKHQVYVGLTTWAAWGDSGWRCVRVLSVGRKFVKIQREDPRTGRVIARRGKALISEMVHRDERKKGKDKPVATPAAMFSEQRKQELEVAAPTPEPAPEPAVLWSQVTPATPEELAGLAVLIDSLEDDSTDDDW